VTGGLTGGLPVRCYTGAMRRFRRIRESDAAMLSALRAVEAHVRPDFRKAVVFGVVALAASGVARGIGGVHSAHLHNRVAAYGLVAVFLILGVAATRSAASELARVSTARAGPAAATLLRVVSLLIGYLVVLLVGLDMFAVPVGHLLVGGAVTGVILGIAAQQTLGNIFAGIVLLFAQPYLPGERIQVRSGALGGVMQGTVTAVGLLYTTLATDDGVLNLPNSGLLAAAVGPLPAADATVDDDDPPFPSTPPGPGFDS
jgi:small-conductance mechanosensitive channel